MIIFPCTALRGEYIYIYIYICWYCPFLQTTRYCMVTTSIDVASSTCMVKVVEKNETVSTGAASWSLLTIIFQQSSIFSKSVVDILLFLLFGEVATKNA